MEQRAVAAYPWIPCLCEDVGAALVYAPVSNWATRCYSRALAVAPWAPLAMGLWAPQDARMPDPWDYGTPSA